MKFSYFNPVKICFNTPYLEALEQIKEREILLITSKSFSTNATKIKNALKDRLVGIIDSISPNPQISHLIALHKNLPKFDSIIALGGGSVLDSAKFFSYFCGFEGDSASFLRHITQGDLTQKALKPIYAFPTTSGTSSEITPWATIWDKESMIKYSLNDARLYPKIAFYDVSLTLSLPLKSTIYTALDALSHAFESVWNKNSNPISTTYALKAIEIILSDLAPLSENLNSMPLRTSIMSASIYAGLAFSNTQTALAHAISYPLTMKFDTPHGLACSFSLPLLLDNLALESNARAILMPFKKRLLDLFATLQISTKPRDYGLDREFIESIFSSLNERAKNGEFDINQVKEAFLSACMANCVVWGGDN